MATRYGDTDFVFGDKQILRESLKVNQCGYSALFHVRYANFANWAPAEPGGKT